MLKNESNEYLFYLYLVPLKYFIQIQCIKNISLNVVLYTLSVLEKCVYKKVMDKIRS